MLVSQRLLRRAPLTLELLVALIRQEKGLAACSSADQNHGHHCRRLKTLTAAADPYQGGFKHDTRARFCRMAKRLLTCSQGRSGFFETLAGQGRHPLNGEL
ncbi:hypothetical protein NDU88_004048 [Pleurodeles waltl]|uniref:Secreted protein n=1 Tax=Pleurodeles waltl TaxID=8319 RepID=A0AAV7VJ55_PLEWA|nr:hypothetical protein NDU88_004048 [Pleurodeles waltl]